MYRVLNIAGPNRTGLQSWQKLFPGNAKTLPTYVTWVGKDRWGLKSGHLLIEAFRHWLIHEDGAF